MENQFANYVRDHPFFPMFSFVQFYEPKMYNVLSIANNLEESTLNIPHSPEILPNSLPLRTDRLETLEESESASEEEERKTAKCQKKGKANRRKCCDDYKPYERQGRKKSNFLKENRNVLPIKIRQMLSFLAREKKSQEVIHRYV